jgi:MFS family permease
MASEGRGSAGRKTFALALLCCASFVAVLDVTIVAIALPSVRRELGFSGGYAQWILTGYALSFGGLLLFMGRAGDLYGRLRLFVGGLALFAGASLFGGLAWAPWVLVVARLLQGIGGARTGLARAGVGHLRRGRGAESRHGRLRRDGWGWVRLRDGARGCDHGVPGLAVGVVRERARGACGALARAGRDPREQGRGRPAYSGPHRGGDGHPRARRPDLRCLRGAEEWRGFSRHVYP